MPPGMIAFVLAFLIPTGLCQTPPATPSAHPNPKCKIEGTVIAADSGRPLRKAVLTLRSDVRSAEPQYAITDSSGHFESAGIDPGCYSLTVSHAGYVRMTYQQ